MIEALGYVAIIVAWLGFCALVVYLLGRGERARVRERRRAGADLQAARRARW